jgi:predicted nucleic acid-binding protein
MTASSTEQYVLLDTSVLIDAEKLDLSDYESCGFVVSAVTVGELAFGVDTGPDPIARTARLRRVISDYEILPYGVEEAKLYGVLATLVRAAGRNPRPRRLDLQIAATAAAARLPLLTCNPDDFHGVDQLVDVVAVRRAG